MAPSGEERPAPAMGTRTRLRVSFTQAEANSRPVGLRFAIMTLRLLERWRTHLGVDLDGSVIVLATAAITMEKLACLGFDSELRDINSSIPADRLTRCNISSIAAATGMNRETTRRKVSGLVDAGILLKDESGSFRLSPDYTRQVPTAAMLRGHLQMLVHGGNELLREGILEVEPSRP